MSDLTENFTEEELDVEDASDEIKKNALVLCQDILEPLRSKIGSIIIHDGYRKVEHNTTVGGVANSFHLYLLDQSAADIFPYHFDIEKAFDYIRLDSKLNFDKVILEKDKETNEIEAIHIQYYTKNKQKNRREAYIGFTHGDGPYTKVNVN